MFCFVTYRYTPHLNLRQFIFSLTPFGWIRSITPTPYLLWDCHFYLSVVIMSTFYKYNYGVQQGLGVHASVQAGSKVHPVSYTMGTGSFPGVKRPGRGVDTYLSPRLNSRDIPLLSPELRKLSVFWKTFDKVYTVLCRVVGGYFVRSSICFCETVDDLLFLRVKFCVEY
jgi:hypothetical protein